MTTGNGAGKSVKFILDGKEVEALDRRIVARKADVRDYKGLKTALDSGVAELGRLDIVSANAGSGLRQRGCRHG